MQNNIYFSVIVPLYNKEKYIEKCINSILNQTYEKFEIIIVNDASTDDSLEIAQSFSDKRIRIITREENGYGGYAARNVGAENSSYNYLAYLDADDEWMPEHLDEIFKLISKFPEQKIFATGWYHKAKNKKKSDIYSQVFKNKELHLVDDYYKNVADNKSAVCNSAIVYDKNAFFEAGKYPHKKCKRMGDVLLWLNLTQNYKIARSVKITAIYNRDVQNSVSKSHKYFEIPCVFTRVKEILPNVDSNEAITLKKFSNLFAKPMILQSIVYNINKKNVIDVFFKDVDKCTYLLFKVLKPFPSFVLIPLYKIYRKIAVIVKKDDVG